MTNVGVVGLNYWGPNLVRNFDALADLTWVCDLDETHLTPVAERYPHWGPANNLVDVVLGRGENQSPAEIGCLTVEFLDAMYRSALADGAPVELS